MDELAFGMIGENIHHGTPVNPQMPSHILGGSSGGSAIVVVAKLVDFALDEISREKISLISHGMNSFMINTIGCVRIPASFRGIIGYRQSHGAVSTIGVLPNSQSLDTIGWFARDPSILHRVGHILLQLNTVEPRRPRRLVFADDLFELSQVPKHKSLYVVSKAAEKMYGYQPPKHINFGQHIASNVPSLKDFCEQSTNLQNGISTFEALSSAMLSLQRCEFKTNHEEWVKSVKPRLGPQAANCVHTAANTSLENIKTLYKDDGILIIPTIADPPLPTNLKKCSSAEFFDRALALISISSMSGCCQVSIPLGKHEGCAISVSFISYHGGDKFLLDSVLDMYSSLQEQVTVASSSLPFADTNGNLDTSELLKEKGRRWNKAVTYYIEAIKLNGTNATYYCNHAAAYFSTSEEDCTEAILLDKKYVKAYLRRGTARESLIRYKEALQDFKRALVLEPQNKDASLAENRVRKLLS
ncbi:hypothetical protein BT93_I0637 [Corymbia citriodora subsp. variegata]|nr:hypothetical protein BT93_I0637 [Corymbia citriodora subsp. variegata]